MKHILILGAGKSSSHLIRHLIENISNLQIKITILDLNIEPLACYKDIVNVELIQIPNGETSIYEAYISNSFLAISMLPASMHLAVAKLCLQAGCHLITPSYITSEMQALSNEVESKQLIFLNELGFDPGIDHLTTMRVYDQIEEQGGKLTSYRSYAGGLVSVKNDDNPWHYKFSWNPSNVIRAGQGGEIKYKKDNVEHKLSYLDLFSKSEVLKISNGQIFDAYANRDSLKYEALYGWEKMETLQRGTLRIHGFCEAWAVLVQLGLTDDLETNKSFKGRTYSEFYSSFLSIPVEEFMANQKPHVQEKLRYIGFTDNTSIIEKNGSAAEILQSVLVEKWKLNPEDTDWVVMVHFFIYELNGKKYEIESYFSLEGESNTYTAMSKTVGMPIAFATELILQNKIEARGVLMPTRKEVYQPILQRLEDIGMHFKETIKEI